MANKEKTRTENVIINSYAGLISQFLTLILSFISRTVFIQYLNIEYLGLNGLFSNVLNILSFAELGVGTAITYALYKPVAYNEKEKIKSLLKFYKKIYSIIGLTIFIIGISIMPILKYIIKDAPNINESLYLIYFLFLFSNAITYFFSSKISFINVNQKNYIVYIYTQAFKILQIILQTVILIVTHNYILYLALQVIISIVSCYFLSKKADKLFPYIKEKYVKPLNKTDKKSIFDNIKGIFLYKLSPAILNGTDNIIITGFVGLAYVGLYSNYYLIINSLVLFISQFNTAIGSSVGNLNAIESSEKKEQVFYKIMYFDFCIYGICSALLISLINNFVNIWIGEEFLLSKFTLFTIILYFYINGMQAPLSTFRTTSGMFKKTKYAPIFEVIINIISSILLAKMIGLPGVFLGTIISKLCVFVWLDPYILYKYLFKGKVVKYIMKYIKYMLIVFITSFICIVLSNIFVATNYFEWFIKAIILGVVATIIFVFFTFNTQEFKYYKELFKELISKKLKRR